MSRSIFNNAGYHHRIIRYYPALRIVGGLVSTLLFLQSIFIAICVMLLSVIIEGFFLTLLVLALGLLAGRGMYLLSTVIIHKLQRRRTTSMFVSVYIVVALLAMPCAIFAAMAVFKDEIAIDVFIRNGLLSSSLSKLWEYPISFFRLSTASDTPPIFIATMIAFWIFCTIIFTFPYYMVFLHRTSSYYTTLKLYGNFKRHHQP